MKLLHHDPSQFFLGDGQAITMPVVIIKLHPAPTAAVTGEESNVSKLFSASFLKPSGLIGVLFSVELIDKSEIRRCSAICAGVRLTLVVSLDTVLVSAFVGAVFSA